MITKYRVNSIDELNYKLIDDNNNEVTITAIFTDYVPKVGDILYIWNKIIKDNTILEFGKLTDEDKNATEEDIIKVISNGNEINLQRYYG